MHTQSEKDGKKEKSYIIYTTADDDNDDNDAKKNIYIYKIKKEIVYVHCS